MHGKSFRIQPPGYKLIFSVLNYRDSLLVSVFIAFLFLFTSCVAYKNTATFTPLQDPAATENVIYSYSTDLVCEPDNHLKRAWANRRNVQVLNFEIINTSDKPIHGSQFSFYSNGEKLEIADHIRAAQKLKTKKFPAVVYNHPCCTCGSYSLYSYLYSRISS